MQCQLAYMGVVTCESTATDVTASSLDAVSKFTLHMYRVYRGMQHTQLAIAMA